MDRNQVSSPGLKDKSLSGRHAREKVQHGDSQIWASKEPKCCWTAPVPKGRSQVGLHGRSYRARVHGQQERHISGRNKTQDSYLLHLRSLTFSNTQESFFWSLHQLQFGDHMSIAGWWAEIVPCDPKCPRQVEERLRTCHLFRCSSCYSGFCSTAELRAGWGWHRFWKAHAENPKALSPLTALWVRELS